MSKLNPCKKCGKVPEMETYPDPFGQPYFRARCESCTYSFAGHSKKWVVQNWNEQNPLPPIEGSAEYWMSQKKGGK